MGARTYRVLETVEYGRELTLPEPFGLVFDTGVLPLGRHADGPPHGGNPCGGPPSCERGLPARRGHLPKYAL